MSTPGIIMATALCFAFAKVGPKVISTINDNLTKLSGNNELNFAKKINSKNSNMFNKISNNTSVMKIARDRAEKKDKEDQKKEEVATAKLNIKEDLKKFNAESENKKEIIAKSNIALENKANSEKNENLAKIQDEKRKLVNLFAREDFKVETLNPDDFNSIEDYEKAVEAQNNNIRSIINKKKKLREKHLREEVMKANPQNFQYLDPVKRAAANQEYEDKINKIFNQKIADDKEYHKYDVNWAEKNAIERGTGKEHLDAIAKLREKNNNIQDRLENQKGTNTERISRINQIEKDYHDAANEELNAQDDKIKYLRKNRHERTNSNVDERVKDQRGGNNGNVIRSNGSNTDSVNGLANRDKDSRINRIKERTTSNVKSAATNISDKAKTKLNNKIKINRIKLKTSDEVSNDKINDIRNNKDSIKSRLKDI